MLVVEDEAHLAGGLPLQSASPEGYAVEVTGDGESALKRLLESNGRFDAVVLDVMLPGIDGFRVVAELRKAGKFVPVLILTARGRPEDVLEGFGAGADDYRPSPSSCPFFSPAFKGCCAATNGCAGEPSHPKTGGRPASNYCQRAQNRLF